MTSVSYITCIVRYMENIPQEVKHARRHMAKFEKITLYITGLSCREHIKYVINKLGRYIVRQCNTETKMNKIWFLNHKPWHTMWRGRDVVAQLHQELTRARSETNKRVRAKKRALVRAIAQPQTVISLLPSHRVAKPISNISLLRARSWKGRYKTAHTYLYYAGSGNAAAALAKPV